MSNNRLWGPFIIKGGDNNFVKTVRDNLNMINRYDLGKRLFAAIKKENETIDIKYVEKSFNADDSGFPLGSNFAFIKCDPQYIFSKDFEPTWKIVTSRKKAFVYYFHEIIHCLHVVSSYFAPSWDAIEEFKTVGLYNYDGAVFTENAFRKILGLPRRPVYTWIGAKTLAREMVVRKQYGLPPKPKDYLRGVEDNFSEWAKWKRKNRK